LNRAAAVLALAFLMAALAAAQHEPRRGEARDLTPWKWANFAILGAGLGYLIAKKAPPLFRSRGQAILKDIAEARRMKEEAEARAAEMEQRMANLPAEIDRLRGAASQELASERERTQAETLRQFQKIQALAARDIASASKAARGELKAYAAQLALDLAEEKIRARMTADTQGALVDNFVGDLERQAGRREVN
jgi:F-type H+-transporting ATPase subunit b